MSISAAEAAIRARQQIQNQDAAGYFAAAMLGLMALYTTYHLSRKALRSSQVSGNLLKRLRYGDFAVPISTTDTVQTSQTWIATEIVLAPK